MTATFSFLFIYYLISLVQCQADHSAGQFISRRQKKETNSAEVAGDNATHRCDNHTNPYPRPPGPPPPFCGGYGGYNASCLSAWPAVPTSDQTSPTNVTTVSGPSATNADNATSTIDGLPANTTSQSPNDGNSSSPSNTTSDWNSTTWTSATTTTVVAPFTNTSSSSTDAPSTETTDDGREVITLDITSLPLHTTITIDNPRRRPSNHTVGPPTDSTGSNTTAAEGSRPAQASASSTGLTNIGPVAGESSSTTLDPGNSTTTGKACSSAVYPPYFNSSTGANFTMSAAMNYSFPGSAWTTSCTDGGSSFHWTNMSSPSTWSNITSTSGSVEPTSFAWGNETSRSEVSTTTVSVSVTVPPFTVPSTGTATFVCINGTCSDLGQSRNTTIDAGVTSSSGSALSTTSVESGLNASTVCNNTNRQVSCTGSDIAWASTGGGGVSSFSTSFTSGGNSSETLPTPQVVVVRSVTVGLGRPRERKARQNKRA